ncbi:polysaccharide deacetylase family protein [Paenibacillus humicola]|uniref:polysaccharide deacetylase family protein n=1 Tax=Paenibacillus humicola TaxID=3110540 RepID=UPI00237A4F6C|nr:polysaccharide deacetylase family protein [Paenibacillus humicola]
MISLYGARKTVLILLAVALTDCHAGGAHPGSERLYMPYAGGSSAPVTAYTAAKTQDVPETAISPEIRGNDRNEKAASASSADRKKKRKKRPARSRAGKQAAVSWVAMQKRYPGAFFVWGPRGTRRAALTFDDVPDPRYTPQVLDILSRHKVRATFFAVGWRAAAYPQLVRRMSREGHVIGNHSYSHAVFSRLPIQQFQREIVRTDAVLRPLAGYSPKLVRPPYGEIMPKQADWLKRSGFIVVNWDVDSVDWRGIDSSKIMANIQKTLQPGSIILLHAGGGTGQDLSGTLNALPRIIKLLRAKGYELVTVPELLGRPAERQSGR